MYESHPIRMPPIIQLPSNEPATYPRTAPLGHQLDTKRVDIHHHRIPLIQGRIKKFWEFTIDVVRVFWVTVVHYAQCPDVDVCVGEER